MTEDKKGVYAIFESRGESVYAGDPSGKTFKEIMDEYRRNRPLWVRLKSWLRYAGR